MKVLFSRSMSLIVAIVFLLGISFVPVKANQEQKAGHEPVCQKTNSSDVRCHARVVVDQPGNPKVTSTPRGFGPAQFRGAYQLSGITSSNRTIAIVDAYNHPSIQTDLDTYSDTFGIPRLPACIGSASASATPCFQKIDQRGETTYPAINAGWALEIALDVEVAHATCQNCKVLLVEADSNSYSNLMTAVDQAVTQGATVVSNSYGSSEFPGESDFDSHFNHPGVAFTFSSGDSGYGTEYPAASPYVTAVGGTTLAVNSDNSYQSETVWSGAGSGCSSYENKPSWQSDSGCLNRTVADVSADADPNTGAAVYSSVRYQGKKGWFKVGGTSLAAPLIASVYALAGSVPTGVQGNSLPYSLGNSSNLNDITSGSNGTCGSYLCSGTTGFDGPTGLGTPKGTSAF